MARRIGLYSGLATWLTLGLSTPVLAQDFTAYCAPLANGEVLESELTPQNMAYIFDDNSQVIGARSDELRRHYSDGISEACDAGDIGAYVSQYGGRVMLEIYPPGQYPLGIAPNTMQAIQASYRQCIAEELAVVDVNQNGRIDEDENARLYRSGERFCNQELAGSLTHAVEMAASQDRVAALNAAQADAEARSASARARTVAAEARIAAANARMQAITDDLIADARREVGL